MNIQSIHLNEVILYLRIGVYFLNLYFEISLSLLISMPSLACEKSGNNRLERIARNLILSPCKTNDLLRGRLKPVPVSEANDLSNLFS